MATQEKERARVWKPSSPKFPERPTTEDIKSWFTLSYWELQTEAASPTSFAYKSWSNKDMDVTLPEHRTWRAWHFLYLWASDGLNVGTMQQASSIIALGLSWREALPAIAIGNMIIAAALVANGVIGAKFHIPFSIISRASFGFYFSYFAVLSRLVLALIYFGVNSYIGCSCTYIMIKSIWPSFVNIPNHLPVETGLTSAKMVAYLVFWIIQLPFVIVPPRKMQWIFFVKSIIVTIAAFALLGWAVHRGGNGEVLAAHSKLTGSTKSWAWVYGMNVAIAGKTTLAINMPDLSRYAKRTSDQYWQLLIIPVIYTLFSFIGIVIASSGEVIYGKVYWDPTEIIALWTNRAAAFFCATAFCLAQLGTNISTNSIAATNDLTFLVPKYLNIKRSAYITAFIGGWATCPWQIQKSGTALTTFLSGYAIVLSPILAIMVSDFWLIRKQHLNVPDLYRNKGIYHYNGGVNWRTVLTLICIVPINIPGLAQKINSSLNIGNMKYVYMFSWLNSFFGSAAIYLFLCYISPPESTLVSESIYTLDYESDVDFKDRGDIEKGPADI